MKIRHITSALWLFAVLCSGAEELDATLHLQNDSAYVGKILARSGDTVSFQPSQAAVAAPVPIQSIKQIDFRFDEEGMAETDALYSNGRYAKLASILNRQMPAYFPYASLPSNLDSKWEQWMAALYWTGDYDQVLETATTASQVQAKSAEVVKQTLFYSMLAFLEKGDNPTRVKQFLDTQKGKLIFPEGSAPRLYVQARLLQQAGQYIPAIRIAAEMIARHGQDADWAPRADLLCAELYFQTGRPKSAEAVLKSIKQCYNNPLIIKKAAVIAAKN